MPEKKLQKAGETAERIAKGAKIAANAIVEESVRAAGILVQQAKEVDKANEGETNIPAGSAEESVDAVQMDGEKRDTPGTRTMHVMCTQASRDSHAVRMKGLDGNVHLGEVEALQEDEIELEENFKGCERGARHECCIVENRQNWILDKKWKSIDEMAEQKDGKHYLKRDKSYMVCIKFEGIIYAVDDGQKIGDLKLYIEGKRVLFLSEEYIEWMKMAEGFGAYPYLCESDSDEAKKRKNVTLGYGFTFDKDRTHWDILMDKDILGWEEEEIKQIIEDVYSGKSIDKAYMITEEQALQLFEALMDEYIKKLNDALDVYIETCDPSATYTQEEMEAMFDYSYNSGLNPNEENEKTIKDVVDNQNRVFYYYLRKDQPGAVQAVTDHIEEVNQRRRLNQMHVFFEKDYEFTDSRDPEIYGTDGLEDLRLELGFSKEVLP